MPEIRRVVPEILNSKRLSCWRRGRERERGGWAARVRDVLRDTKLLYTRLFHARIIVILVGKGSKVGDEKSLQLLELRIDSNNRQSIVSRLSFCFHLSTKNEPFCNTLLIIVLVQFDIQNSVILVINRRR